MAGPALFLATVNLGKVAEFQKLLGQFALSHPKRPEFAHLKAPHVVEDGTTYFENALKKAMRYHEVYRVPVLADDSGLEVDLLKGEPGVNSAYYGGDNLSWADRWSALWAALRPFPHEPWTARFRAVFCYYDGQSVPKFFEGTTEGKVLSSAKGGEGFGYDPIFWSALLGKSFGEASAEDKNRISHRAAAVQAFLKWRESLDHPDARR